VRRISGQSLHVIGGKKYAVAKRIVDFHSTGSTVFWLLKHDTGLQWNEHVDCKRSDKREEPPVACNFNHRRECRLRLFSVQL